MSFNLSGKTALVTGSGRGIGRAIAGKLAAAGAQVMLNDVDEAVLRETEAEFKKAGFAVGSASGDLLDAATPDRIVQQVVNKFGSIDIIVNNAGYSWDGVIQKTTDEQFRAMLEIHLVTPFRILRAASSYIGMLPRRRSPKARSSCARSSTSLPSRARTGIAGQAGYSSGKAGVIGLTRTLAKEWGRYNVNVNAVGFGLINTRMVQPLTGGDSTIEMGGHDIKIGVQPAMLESVKGCLPTRTCWQSGRSRGGGTLLLLSALGLRYWRSADLRRRIPLLGRLEYMPAEQATSPDAPQAVSNSRWQALSQEKALSPTCVSHVTPEHRDGRWPHPTDTQGTIPRACKKIALGYIPRAIQWTDVNSYSERGASHPSIFGQVCLLAPLPAMIPMCPPGILITVLSVLPTLAMTVSD